MDSENNGGADATNASHRRRYEHPAVVESAEFETLALACGKVPPSPPAPAACGYNPSAS